MSFNVILFYGSVDNIPFIKSFASPETNLGMLYYPANIFLYNAEVLGSSNGRYPHIIAKSITPHDHISTFNPSYFFPAIISGAA
jgi:hypothetical protein